MAIRVLVVDDQIFIREIIRSILESASLEVIGEASSGLEAIEQYRALRPDVVTMDLVMPHLSGTEAAKRILNYDPKALIIPVSGLSQPSVLAEAMDVGMQGFVPKPIESDELIAEIKDVVEG